MRPIRFPRAARCPRRGISLVEVVLAILLFTTGCLALLSSQTALTRLRNRSAGRTHLAALALAILDSLRAAPCATAGAGSRSVPHGRVDWSTAPGPRTTSLTVVVQPADGPPWTAESLAPCLP